MWASKATYLTQLGQVYAKITDQAVEAIIVRFFGFFFLGMYSNKNYMIFWRRTHVFVAWQSAELWGNLISSLVLSSGAHGSGGGHSGNSSDASAALELCGANFCVVQTTDNANLERPPDSEIFEISAIYLTVCESLYFSKQRPRRFDISVYSGCCYYYCSIYGPAFTLWWETTRINFCPGAFGSSTSFGYVQTTQKTKSAAFDSSNNSKFILF